MRGYPYILCYEIEVARQPIQHVISFWLWAKDI